MPKPTLPQTCTLSTGEPDALVAEVDRRGARLRAHPRRSVPLAALLQHAAEPAVTLSLVPTAERNQLFALVNATLADPAASESDRANARAVAARRNRTSAARLAGDLGSELAQRRSS